MIRGFMPLGERYYNLDQGEITAFVGKFEERDNYDLVFMRRNPFFEMFVDLTDVLVDNHHFRKIIQNLNMVISNVLEVVDSGAPDSKVYDLITRLSIPTIGLELKSDYHVELDPSYFPVIPDEKYSYPREYLEKQRFYARQFALLQKTLLNGEFDEKTDLEAMRRVWGQYMAELFALHRTSDKECATYPNTFYCENGHHILYKTVSGRMRDYALPHSDFRIPDTVRRIDGPCIECQIGSRDYHSDSLLQVKDPMLEERVAI